MKVDIRITHLSGERLWDYDKPLPSKVNLSININLMEITRKDPVSVEAPFMFTINYSPPVAHISIKGKVFASGSEDEISSMMDEQQRTKRPPAQLLQAVSSACMAEAVLLSRSINIPPPIPPLPPPPTGKEAGPSTSYTR
ncbi:MAG: hypothetical protein DRJ97_00695 [Thermoprotei archaeon]|nr:MAG: hypothetical protein DRJ97_00695 [Thermoprotei archaeon]